MNRKQALKTLVAGAAGALTIPAVARESVKSMDTLKNNINHSVCQWCYSSMPLEDLVIAAKEIGITSVELLKPEEWGVVQKHGLTCAMGYASFMGLKKGFNDTKLHAQLLKDYTTNIPKAADAGLKNVICFSGDRQGLTDKKGLENCAKGLDPVLKIAAKYNINVCMELLNSKVDHKDQQCDHTEWGVKLCEKTGSSNFKLLYDIYHMQIMEGDVIATINKYIKYIGHFHTGGVPGRHEIDETQELFYPAIMRAIVKTGYTGFVGQEFIPSNPDKIMSLRKGVEICDV